ncbi:MAG: spore maturation protein [Anaerotignaceae bacterium]
MKIAIYISNMIMPIFVLGIVIFGYLQKVDIYNVFTEGAKEGLKTVVHIVPSLIGLLCGVAVLRASGFLDALSMFLSPVAEALGFPTELIPLGMMKAISSSGALGLLIDIFKTEGPDSFVGRLASVMMGSTETIFYTMSIYLMSVGITKSRYILRGAVLSTLAGIIGAYFVVLFIFG